MRKRTVKPRRTVGQWMGVLLVSLLGTGILAGYLLPEPDIIVYKSPYCGCCKKWIDHLEDSDFRVRVINSRNMDAIKKDLGLPFGLASCHTAVVGGKYVIEGHVPAPDIHSLVKGKVDAAGLAVPGMPVGSPGMEGPNPVEYEVLAFDTEGNTTVFATHKGKEY